MGDLGGKSRSKQSEKPRRTDVKQTIIQCKLRLQENYQVTQLGLLGSYVWGEQTETIDLDVLSGLHQRLGLAYSSFANSKTT